MKLWDILQDIEEGWIKFLFTHEIGDLIVAWSVYCRYVFIHLILIPAIEIAAFVISLILCFAFGWFFMLLIFAACITLTSSLDVLRA